MKLAVGLACDHRGMIIEVFDFRAIDRNGEVALIHSNEKADALIGAGVLGKAFGVEKQDRAGPSWLSAWR